MKEISLDDEYKQLYKRQIEIYQWLLRQNGFKVSKIGYFVFVNGQTDRKAFDGRLEFDVLLMPHKGDCSWVEQTLYDMYKYLNSSKIPKSNADCDYCRYVEAVGDQINHS
jgi:hypothetical protein